MIQKIKIYQVLYIITIIIYGCSPINSVPINTPPPEQKDLSPFNGIPCSAPCWYGLVINESREEDVKKVVSKLSFINQDTVTFNELLLPSLDPNIYKPGIEINAECLYLNKECLNIRVVDNVLLEIHTILNYEISLNESITHLGIPDFIGYEDAGTEQISCQVLVIWVKNQIILKSERFYGLNEYKKNCESISLENSVADILISEVSYLALNIINSSLNSDTYQFKRFSEISIAH